MISAVGDDGLKLAQSTNKIEPEIKRTEAVLLKKSSFIMTFYLFECLVCFQHASIQVVENFTKQRHI